MFWQNTLLPILQTIAAQQDWLLRLSPSLHLLLIGTMLALMLALTGFVLARLGYRPLWALLLLVPTLGVVAVWVLAYRAFPVQKRKA